MDGLPFVRPEFSPSPFDRIKHINEHGADYWSARELQVELGYTTWRNFVGTVNKALKSCENSGNTPEHHIVSANKEIEHGKGAVGTAEDFHLSRFGCYLIAQNGDPRKPQIAMAQKYFAIQTRRQELTAQLEADRERVELREQVSDGNRALSGVAKQVGVQSQMFGVFHDAGYIGMYGMKNADIKRNKGIPKHEQLVDRMGATELAANSFRITQAKDKLSTGRVASQQHAINIHQDVGREVRSAIQKIGGVMPELIPADEHIRHAKNRLAKGKPKITLEQKDAMGLLPTDVAAETDYDVL